MIRFRCCQVTVLAVVFVVGAFSSTVHAQRLFRLGSRTVVPSRPVPLIAQSPNARQRGSMRGGYGTNNRANSTSRTTSPNRFRFRQVPQTPPSLRQAAPTRIVRPQPKTAITAPSAPIATDQESPALTPTPAPLPATGSAPTIVDSPAVTSPLDDGALPDPILIGPLSTTPPITPQPPTSITPGQLAPGMTLTDGSKVLSIDKLPDAPVASPIAPLATPPIVAPATPPIVAPATPKVVAPVNPAPAPKASVTPATMDKTTQPSETKDPLTPSALPRLKGPQPLRDPPNIQDVLSENYGQSVVAEPASEN